MKILYHKIMIIALIMITITVANAAGGINQEDEKLLIDEDVAVLTNDEPGSSFEQLMQNAQKNEYSLGIARSGAVPSTNTFDIFSHTVLTLPDDPRNVEPWSQVINNQDEWESFFYAQTAHITYPQGEAPIAAEFDFEKHQVLTGGLGVRSSGGHSLVVEGVFELDNVINIQVLEIRPDTQCIVPAVISYPSATVLVKKTDKPFQFTVTQLVNECLD